MRCTCCRRQAAHDLLVADLMMPRMDGLELICEVRQDPRWAHIPVTVLAEQECVGRLKRLGCASFLVKPVREQELIAAVHRALETTPAQEREIVAAAAR